MSFIPSDFFLLLFVLRLPQTRVSDSSVFIAHLNLFFSGYRVHGSVDYLKKNVNAHLSLFSMSDVMLFLSRTIKRRAGKTPIKNTRYRPEKYCIETNWISLFKSFTEIILQLLIAVARSMVKIE